MLKVLEKLLPTIAFELKETTKEKPEEKKEEKKD